MHTCDVWALPGGAGGEEGSAGQASRIGNDGDGPGTRERGTKVSQGSVLGTKFPALVLPKKRDTRSRDILQGEMKNLTGQVPGCPGLHCLRDEAPCSAFTSALGNTQASSEPGPGRTVAKLLWTSVHPADTSGHVMAWGAGFVNCS